MRTFLSIMMVCAASVHLSSARADLAPIEGLIARPAGYAPLPRPRPDPMVLFERDCAPRDAPEVEWARLAKVDRMATMRQMLGQLIVISFSGTSPADPSVKAVAGALARSEIGGVLYFRYNVGTAADVAAVNALYTAAHPRLPAVIAIDQEGGAVTRLKPSEGAPDTPSAATIAEGSVEGAADAYEAMAKRLSELGFTANFGPVVDLLINPNNPVIARFGRSFGRDPDTVTRYAKQFVLAHRAEGVATALKHFPGHGSSTADSHDGAIDLNPTWSPVELEPFRSMIEDDLSDMIMIGHLELDGFSGPGALPASLSPRAITERLREAMCFDGLIVSDDLSMDAIASTWPLTEAVRLMIDAGGDLALLSLPSGTGLDDISVMLDELAAVAEADPLFADKVRFAYARVVNHKLDMKAIREAEPDESHLASMNGGESR